MSTRYGGVYVPTLSQAVKNDPTVDWNMQGLLVGNGVPAGSVVRM